MQPIKLRNLREHVHDQIRSAILSGELSPGLRLNERELAARLDVSTSPLKEALRQLEGEGLVETSPRRGTFVTFSASQAEEMTFARAAIESMLARLAAKRGEEAHFDTLAGLIEDMRAAVASADIEALIALNEAFHGAIHEASGCTYLLRLQRAQRMYDQTSRHTVLMDQAVRAKSFAEHEAIKDAVVGRDEEAAERLMKEHILKAGQIYIKMVFDAEARTRLERAM
jgi:DNA-binding GntR family transcriptional regulator